MSPSPVIQATDTRAAARVTIFISTHFVNEAERCDRMPRQAILYRGADFDVVWPSFLALLAIGSLMFYLSLRRFRTTIGSMA